MDLLRQHEIAEASHRILNPFTDEKLELLGQLCRWRRDMCLLDLASGKGGALHLGPAARHPGPRGWTSARCSCRRPGTGPRTWGWLTRVRFVAGAGAFGAKEASFDAVACIGATWIGGGLGGTVSLLKPALAPGRLLLIGEPFWRVTRPGWLAALEVGPPDSLR